MSEPPHDPSQTPTWDHSSREEFFEYYSRESRSPETLARYGSIRDAVLRTRPTGGVPAVDDGLDVADIGCGAGTQCLIWARDGHRVHGLDVNEPLVELARERAREESLEVDFRIGSASELPWNEGSFDVCLVPELLEHVENWEECLDEFCRILRPGGVLFLSTTNTLCPIQQEFNLPLYSWYPAPLKRRYERLARTTRPELVNHATYPAVNWFTFYSLRRALARRGLDARDRFDVMETENKSPAVRFAIGGIRKLPPLRLLAHAATPSTLVVAVKRNG